MAPSDSGKNEEEASQSYAALGVGLVCILVGLPLWWKTTEVYRVSLPYADIEQLYSEQASHRVPFSIVVFEKTWDQIVLPTLGRKLKESFENIESHQKEENGVVLSSYRGNIRWAYEEELALLNTSRDIEDFDDHLVFSSEGLHEVGRYYIVVLPSDSSLDGLANGIIGRHRTAFIRAPKSDPEDLVPQIHHVVRELLVDEASMTKAVLRAQAPSRQQTSKASMRALHYHPAYDMTFTLFNPQPDILNVTWDISFDGKKYFQSVVKAFGGVAEITVKSQSLHYAHMAVRPQWDSSGNFLILHQDRLPHIINPVEAYLGSHVSVAPQLNFIVYIPSRDQSPLYLLNDKGERVFNNAFLSPRWGGMLIYNLPSPKNESLPAARNLDMRVVMETFVSQLRLLLGIPPSPSSSGFSALQPGLRGVSAWEVDKWMRCHALENVATAASTLQSLVQLLSQVGNIVINEDIGKEVSRAVDSILACKRHLKAGRLQEAMLSSRQASISSEKAFFDPSLLELLYFPEDQKFAIYIPLFLPVSIPIVLSLLRALKWLKNNHISRSAKCAK